jgi:acyl phosphate:glycerol-3-phosphate acyltransferase
VDSAVVIGLLIPLAYLLGTVPSGYVLGRRRGIDIRQHGSGNIGATNVLRTIGKGPAALALIGDLAKGAVPVFVGRALGLPLELQYLAGLAAVAGHIWPVWLRFRGGRGVATAFGALLAIAPLPGLVVALIFVLTVASSRYVSLGSILGSLAAPLIVWLWGYPTTVSLLTALVSGFIVVRHRGNIQRLLTGNESRLGQRLQG